LAASESLISRNDLRDSGVCSAVRPYFEASSESMMKQCKMAVDEKEKTERKMLARRYAMNTTMMVGKIGE
jgi:hypothetical protein